MIRTNQPRSTGELQARQQRCCRACGFFHNDAATLEATFKGLTSFSSAHASVRSEDGLCQKHDRYLSADATCPAFVPRAG